MDKEATEKKKFRKRWKNRDGRKTHSTASSMELMRRDWNRVSRSGTRDFELERNDQNTSSDERI